MKGTISIIINFTLMVITFFLFFTALTYIRPRYNAWREANTYKEQLEAEVADLQQQIIDVKRNRTRFQTSPYFVEQLARKNHRIADNEIVFIFE